MKKLTSPLLQEKLKIVVKCVGKLDGKDLCLTIGSNASVMDLKKLISRELNSKGDGPIPIDRQRLIFFGRMLKDNKQVLSGEGGVNMKTDGSTNFVHLSPLPADAAAASTPNRAASNRKPPEGTAPGIDPYSTSPSLTPSNRGPRPLTVAGILRRSRRAEPYPRASRDSVGRTNRTALRSRYNLNSDNDEDNSDNEITTATSTNRTARSAAVHPVDDVVRLIDVHDEEEDAVVPQDALSAPGLLPGAFNPHSDTSLREAQRQLYAAIAAADGSQTLLGAGFDAYATEPGFSSLPASVFLPTNMPSAFAGTATSHPTSHQNRLLVATLATRFLPDVTQLSDRLRDIVWSAVMGGNSPDAFDQQVAVTINTLERISRISASLADTLHGASDSATATASALESLASITSTALHSSHGMFSPSTLMSSSTLGAADFSVPRWGLAPQQPPSFLTAYPGQHPTFLGIGSSAVGNDLLESYSADPALLASIASVAPTVAALYSLGSDSLGQFMSGYPPPPPSGF